MTPRSEADVRPPGPPVVAADDGRWGILLFAGAVALTALTCLDAAIVPVVGVRLAVLAAAVGVIAERSGDARTALGCAGLAFALGDGFLQRHGGQLTWEAVDFPYLLGLVGATALGMCVAQIRQSWGAGRRRAVTGTGGLRHPSRKHKDPSGRPATSHTVGVCSP